MPEQADPKPFVAISRDMTRDAEKGVVTAQKQRITAAIELIDAALKTEESLDRKSDNVWRFLDAANERLYETLRLIDGPKLLLPGECPHETTFLKVRPDGWACRDCGAAVPAQRDGDGS